MPETSKNPLNKNKYSADLDWLIKNIRLTNYISVSTLYLKDNFWLEEPLVEHHLKERVVGHWGTVPGLNLIYAGLNWLNFNLHIGNGESRFSATEDVKKVGETLNDQYSPAKMLLIVGPGHGAPAILSNLWLEGSLGKYYPQYPETLTGAENLIKNFSWPEGFPSHTYPGLPGSINEGGELGYSLGLAYGSILSNPHLITVCVVGDGEAETGALAASWQSNKFINRESDGAVLPILHLNDYKISGPTVYSRMSDEDLFKYFEGLNYKPFLVTQNFADLNESEEWLTTYLETLTLAYQQIVNYKAGKTTKLPVILLRTLKGWTGPKFANGGKIEGNNLAHGLPLKNPKQNKAEFEVLKSWLESYKIEELVDTLQNTVRPEVTKFLPSPENRLGNIQSTLSLANQPLALPDILNFQIQTLVKGQNGNLMVHVSKYLSQIISQNPNKFRIFSPDEAESNRLETLYENTDRVFNLPLKEWDDNLGESGQIMEILSEQTLQSWMQGYNAFGGYGILISYEAFLAIIISQIDQFIKYSSQANKFNWRGSRPSMNYIATSTTWRQDHNGFTHQNPVLINTLLSKNVDFANVYFPVDVNIGLEVAKKVLTENNTVNLIVAGKTDLPQWLDVNKAKAQVEAGIMEWEFAGNSGVNNSQNSSPDIILASAGDYQTLETMAAISWLKQNAPELSFKYVNISQLTSFGLGAVSSTENAEQIYKRIFPENTEVLINFHGYPSALKQILYGTSLASKTTILGYMEQGSTTTPFDMQVLNGTSRFDMAIKALEIASKNNSIIAEKSVELIQILKSKLVEHKKYIVENGNDLPEVLSWKWEEQG